MNTRCGSLLVPLLLAAGTMPACAHNPCPGEFRMDQLERLDLRLRQAVVEQPDSVVGVLLRTTHSLTASDRRELEQAGLSIGTTVGDIVTGRLRACDAPRVAQLSFVRHMELAGTIPLPRPVIPE